MPAGRSSKARKRAASRTDPDTTPLPAPLPGLSLSDQHPIVSREEAEERVVQRHEPTLRLTGRGRRDARGTWLLLGASLLLVGLTFFGLRRPDPQRRTRQGGSPTAVTAQPPERPADQPGAPMTRVSPPPPVPTPPAPTAPPPPEPLAATPSTEARQPVADIPADAPPPLVAEPAVTTELPDQPAGFLLPSGRPTRHSRPAPERPRAADRHPARLALSARPAVAVPVPPVAAPAPPQTSPPPPQQLTREVLRATMVRAEPVLRGCVREGWGSDVSIGIRVQPTGAVQSAEVQGALAQSATGRCLEQKIMEVRFPPFTRGGDKQLFWLFHLPSAEESPAVRPGKRKRG